MAVAALAQVFWKGLFSLYGGGLGWYSYRHESLFSMFCFVSLFCFVFVLSSSLFFAISARVYHMHACTHV
ncbi:hypothetical protein HOY82DRAFT_560723 [Tuber indicum]|nr:hypothetical protein HOY82DRAFT_560723 [Tuber indicum]